MRRCYIILLSAMLCQCARIGQPSGGPKDIDAPQLLQSIPENGQKNFNGKNIELVFDEYIKLKDAKEEIVILLDVKVSDSFSRKKQRRDKFEKDKTFALKIAGTYKKLAKKYGWHIVNASQNKDQVHQQVRKIILKHMK